MLWPSTQRGEGSPQLSSGNLCSPIPANGQMRWDSQIWTLLFANGAFGTQDKMWGPNARSSRATSGPFASISTNTDQRPVHHFMLATREPSTEDSQHTTTNSPKRPGSERQHCGQFGMAVV
jgi:hypothetical protein